MEFNIHSNLALNNIYDVSQLPIRKYIDNDIPVFLGQDGGGIYQTDGGQEALVARFAGAREEELLSIRRSEDAHIGLQDFHFRAKAKQPRAFEVPREMPDAAPYRRQSAAAAEIRKRKMEKEHTNIERMGVSLDDEARRKATHGKTPVLLSGSGSSFHALSKEEQQEIRTGLKMLVDQVDPAKAYFITSGYNHGVENQFHDVASESKKKPHIVLAMAENTKAGDTTARGARHGLFIGSNRQERSQKVIDYLERKQGEAIFIGGGTIVNDQIMTAMNKNLSCHLMQGTEGASEEKAAHDRTQGFQGARGMIRHLYKTKPDLFRKDFDITKVDEIYKSASRETRRALEKERETHAAVLRRRENFRRGKKSRVSPPSRTGGER